MSLDTSSPSSHPALSATDGLANSLADLILLIGRLLLGWIFLQYGWMKLMDIPAFMATLPGRGLPSFMGYIAPPVEVIGALMIMLGLGTRYAALLMIAFTVVATLSSHAYWSFPAAQQGAQMLQFMKNVTIMGGLLVLFVTAGGRFSLDALMRRS